MNLFNSISEWDLITWFFFSSISIWDGKSWNLFADLTYNHLHNENLSSFEKYLKLLVFEVRVTSHFSWLNTSEISYSYDFYLIFY